MAFTILLSVALTIFSILVFRNINSRPSSRLPPGNTGWPILGETLSYIPNPAKFISDRMKMHSRDIFQTSLAGEKMAIFCGASGNKFIHSNDSKFKMWLPRTVIDILGLTNIDSNSPPWKLFDEQLHKFLRLESMQHYVPIMDTKVREHLEMHWMPFKEVKVLPLSKEFTIFLFCHLVLNIYDSDQVKELATPYNNLVKGLMSVPINLPGTTYNRAINASKVVREKLLELVRKRKMEVLAKKDYVNFDGLDFLGGLLRASIEGGDIISEMELVGKIIAFLFAAFHTTGNTITFLMAHLAEYPDVYAKVLQEQLEIAQSKEKGELLSWKDIQRMKYSWNVVCETMRLRPPALGGFRELATDVHYGGYTIPKGWKVHWSAYSTHMDPIYFPEPERFNPSRFEENHARGVYVPFGSGPRMCCGNQYARMKILVFLHNVVIRFRLSKVNPNERILYTPDPVFVDGLRIRLDSQNE
ncbi:protopanaxadiol 6-hydroxylase-like [Chenopodium quinoa]|uniref:protopanaxadiol 6-hydroxylase-like n=1 Tax=Chenopodium quinoa TaxID=63459 RepID=UPI000B781E66|nr:protopanaxadiol 6-hydroxylase-like [Chenopodium quinoa]